ncbi:MAG: hypothetical protein QM754_00550 [Tepidisphaeraceae bacterium]
MATETPNPLQRAFESGVVSIKDLMAGTGFSRPTVERHMRGKTKPDAADRALYAKTLRIDPVRFDELWFGGSIEDTITPNRIEDNVPPPGELIPAIPEWPTLRLAASHWLETDEVGEVIGEHNIQAAWKLKRFRVRLAGSCMEPAWPDASLVEFEMLVDGTDFEVGKDYYVQTHEGATFKRCISKDGETVTVGCINGKPLKRWTVNRSDIQRAARGVYRLTTPD